MVGLLGGEVDPIYPPGAQGGGDEKDVLLLVEGLPEAVVGLPGQVAVSEPGVIQAPELVQADVESPEVLELVHHAAGLVGLVLQLLPPPVQGGDAPGEGIEIGSEILPRGRGVEGA